MRDFFRGAGGDDHSAAAARFGAEVDEIIGALDHFEIVLDHKQAVALRGEALEDFEQHRHVVEMQAGGRLVEDQERAAFPTALAVRCCTQLEPFFCDSPPDRTFSGWPRRR
ncbi:MAG: hypothetical protein QM796_03980 [Chthoniobacteraceae bacterium]